jgi:hypothetical protein
MLPSEQALRREPYIVAGFDCANGVPEALPEVLTPARIIAALKEKQK